MTPASRLYSVQHAVGYQPVRFHLLSILRHLRVTYVAASDSILLTGRPTAPLPDSDWSQLVHGLHDGHVNLIGKHVDIIR